VLFGKTNPSGKLPFTYPRTTGDIHVPYWHWYSDVTTPLFPFGFGLSYTSTTVSPCPSALPQPNTP
jgi:beta-glucosidase